jgi:NAD(P)H-flavin reductase/NAD-dependent dihydropyrimidine dehydrogenase PreA subunit
MAQSYETSESSVLSALEQASKYYKLAALTKKNGKIIYDYVDGFDDILLEYTPTILSPKKFFFPQNEVILEYDTSGNVASKIEAVPLLLFGIRPCDANSIKLLDEAFSESLGDPNYLAKKEQSIVIAIDCLAPCDEEAFCFKVGSHYASKGFDIMLKPTELGYGVCSATPNGDAFISTYLTTTTPLNNIDTTFDALKDVGFKGKTLFPNLSNFPAMFKENIHHSIWDEEGSKCLSCGSCILVCPTCYCFDVADEMKLNLKEGQRVRRWDACMLSNFAEVSGGENFREAATHRLKHRIGRKFQYLMEKHNQSVCVGCGRCVRACLPNISPKDIAEAIIADTPIKESTIDTLNKELYTPSTIKGVKQERDLYLPEKVEILEIQSFTEKEKFYKVKLCSGRPLGHDPGQFVQVSILGIGEAPISISSPPDGSDTFDLCVRAVGDVTNALHTLKKGENFYIRGPFGKGFDRILQKELEGKHVVFVVGGIGYVPARSLINQLINSPQSYEKISILYGCKSPQDRMYKNDLERIRSMGGNVTLLETVDHAGESWHGTQGVITTLIPRIDMNPKNTKVIIIGPPIMYKFVLVKLLDHSIEPNSIYMSLERRMKCGVGKCGHCQMGGVYVCQKGPVFRYSDVKDNEEVL